MSLKRSNEFRPTLEVLEDRSTPSVILSKIAQVVPPTLHQVAPPSPKPKPVINHQPPYIFNPLALPTGGFTLPNNAVLGTNNGFTLNNNAVIGTNSGFTLKNNAVIGTSTGFGTPVSQSTTSGTGTQSTTSGTGTTTQSSTVADPTQATQDLINALSQPFTFGTFPSSTK